MIKVVLDTNIFISSIFWKGSPHRVVEKAVDGKINVFTSIEILQELDKVLRRDFEEPDEMVYRQISLIREYIVCEEQCILDAMLKETHDFSHGLYQSIS